MTESYLFNNGGKTTWNDPDGGTLQFALPAAANGKVEVNVLAPGGLPIRRAADPQMTKLGTYAILRKEDRDGTKCYLDAPKHGNGADAWVLFRASGTERMLRCYVEAATPELVEEILESGERFVRQS